MEALFSMKAGEAYKKSRAFRLAGLRKAYGSEASLRMQADQQKTVDFVREHLQAQKQDPHKEIIVISDDPGTGKTIVGIRFILEYVNIFHKGRNDNKAIFCLPRSQTVKAVFDAACAVDEEYEKEYCCYLQEIGKDQNLVVVDEGHRITELERTLDEVFRKGTRLLIILQDDHQLVRPGEQGTCRTIRPYADRAGIPFFPMDIRGENPLELIDEKRCDEKLLKGLHRLFYDESVTIEGRLDAVRVFDRLEDLERWERKEAVSTRTKFVLPFCWPWIMLHSYGAMIWYGMKGKQDGS
ncbi:MAG: DEAD/DEAH box helicase family protein [Clostridiales bacterium]|nr:DEAD/DEAH box helicase family protein [Clostridiales bacterium]